MGFDPDFDAYFAEATKAWQTRIELQGGGSLSFQSPALPGLFFVLGASFFVGSRLGVLNGGWQFVVVVVVVIVVVSGMQWRWWVWFVAYFAKATKAKEGEGCLGGEGVGLTRRCQDAKF